jgi:hypothetical protein
MTMTNLGALLWQYIERFESGGSVDPSDLLDQVQGEERRELGELIEGYLELGAPPQRWSAEAFEGSIAERAVNRATESWTDDVWVLPAKLVELRNERKLKRSELVSRLSEWLGVRDREEKVAWYYNQLERGRLEAEAVSPKVWSGLANILQVSADTLRRAGGSVAPSAGGEPAPVMARTTRPAAAEPAPDQAFEQRADDETADETDEKDWDEVDRLFRGGVGG